MFDVVYLTGPPAAGKSTLLESLKDAVEPLETFSYSKALAEHVSRRDEEDFSQDDMRRHSARLIRPEDVQAVDELLLDLAATTRKHSHLVIDTHAVTKESYGYRVTAFSLEQVTRLAPTKVFVLYAAAPVIMERIASNSQGRPSVTHFEADFHLHLQASVALVYGVNTGIPVYFLDSSQSVTDLVSAIADRLTTQ